MPLGTQPYYRPPTPNTSPGGRAINPATGRIADMPGGLNYLAGFGPAPAGVQDINVAPIIHPGAIPNIGGGNQTQTYLNGLLKFWPNFNRGIAGFTNPYTHQIEAPRAGAPPGVQNITNALTAYSQNPNPTDYNAIHQYVMNAANSTGASALPSAPAAVPTPVPATPTVPTIQWAGSTMPYIPSPSRGGSRSM